MPDSETNPSAMPRRRAFSRRAFDFSILVGCFAAVLGVLSAFGFLGALQAVTASALMASLAAAYFAGSSVSAPEAETPVAAETAAPRAPDTDRVLQALPLPAFELDRDGRIIAFNAPADAVMQLTGKGAPRASTVIRSPALLTAIDKARTIGADPALTDEFDAEGDQTWRLHVSRGQDSERTLVLLEDLTAVRRSARARSDFLANASHELRTPLTTISGLVETLRGPARSDPDSWDRFFDIMARESQRMNRLIADLLSLSRIESSQRSIPREKVDFNVVVRECAAHLQPIAVAQSVKLTLLGPDAPLPIIAHRDEMIQVVENLLSNALKYSPAGGQVTAEIGASDTLSDARMRAAQRWSGSERMTILQAGVRGNLADAAVWLRVEDSGPGIETEHLPRLGERFYRADQSRGGKITGTGLGLAIVKHIMTHHRGGLAIETQLARGSAFGVWFATPKITARESV
jgi:two-component system, OmpR family, phosphate regulon sensor histidine kinase PhoR